jgi:MSHA biogenesis protein MshI
MNFFGQNKQSRQAGLFFQLDRLALALVERAEGGHPQLLEAISLPIAEDTAIERVLKDVKKEYQLHKIPCVWVMEPGSYSLLQVEAPNVPADEMRAALHWKIKDLIDFHIDDATIDMFEFPAAVRSGMSGLVNVVVARTATIQRRVNLLHSVNIEPRAIDITELALHNVAQACRERKSAASAAMYLLPENVYIEIADKDSLYLSRNIEANLDELTTPNSSNEGSWGTTSHEMLILEMQRSMDFYESQYENGPAAEMRIFQKINDDGAFVKFARQQLPFKIDTAPINESIPGIEHIDEQLLSDCLPAIGAALREV